MNIKTKLLAVSLIAASFLGAATAQNVDAEAGYVSPQEVEPNTTVSNQEFNVVVENLSADGDTDHVYFEFPHFLNESLSPNTVDTNISVSSSKTLVDQDDDGVKESVHVGLSRDGDGAVNGNITLDIGIDYPAEFDSFPVEVKVNDSSNGAHTTTLNVENTEAADEETTNSTEDDSTSDSDTEDSQDSTDNTTDDSTNTTDDSNTDETGSNETENNESTDDTSDSNTDETEEETNSTEDEETSNQDSQNSTEDGSTPEDGDSSESDEGIVEAIISFFTGLF